MNIISVRRMVNSQIQQAASRAKQAIINRECHEELKRIIQSLRDSVNELELSPSQLIDLKAEKKDEDDKIHALVTLVNEIFDECNQIHKAVIRNMPEYTLHDEVHLKRVVELMDRLIPLSTLQNLSPLELAGLILSASLHDIGMAPPQEKVRSLLRKPIASENDHCTDPESVRYHAFRESYPEVIKRYRL